MGDMKSSAYRPIHISSIRLVTGFASRVVLDCFRICTDVAENKSLGTAEWLMKKVCLSCVDLIKRLVLFYSSLLSLVRDADLVIVWTHRTLFLVISEKVAAKPPNCVMDDDIEFSIIVKFNFFHYYCHIPTFLR